MGLKYLVPPSLLVALVLGSIFFGVASPTEAGAVGSIGATILSLVYTSNSHGPPSRKTVISPFALPP